MVRIRIRLSTILDWLVVLFTWAKKKKRKKSPNIFRNLHILSCIHTSSQLDLFLFLFQCYNHSYYGVMIVVVVDVIAFLCFPFHWRRALQSCRNYSLYNENESYVLIKPLGGLCTVFNCHETFRLIFESNQCVVATILIVNIAAIDDIWNKI